MTRIETWFLAARPKTLGAALVPVLVATVLAHAEARASPVTAIATLLVAVLVQVGTNLANDYYDFQKGADTAERLGPPRAAAQGLIPPPKLLRGSIVCFACAASLWSALAWAGGGWPIIAVAAASIASGFGYTGGPFPLGYHGLGDVFVFVFFGPVAVCSTYYLHTGRVSGMAWWLAVSVGALATAILVVNNLRDRVTDMKAAKRTLAVRLGPGAARVEYALLIAVAFGIPAGMFLTGGHSAWLLLPLVGLPLAWSPGRLVFTAPSAQLNAALVGTALLEIAFGVMVSVGLLLSAHGP